MTKKLIFRAMLTLIIVVGIAIGYGVFRTEKDIGEFEQQILTTARDNLSNVQNIDFSELPAPVRRYFTFVFDTSITGFNAVEISAEGQFRRPLTETFNRTTANQTIAITTPALMFSATTPLIPGVWARAYDYYSHGEMEMKAKILSTLTVVDEKESEALNQISLRRWLLESALYPQSLLPGGPVIWEVIDDQSARATVTTDHATASMVAVFDESGRMTEMFAEEDGNLSTPYHGSGEHVSRSDYHLVQGQMIPHTFEISRMAQGKKYPFWRGTLTEISFK